MTYFGIFDQKSIILVFFEKKIKNTIVIFQIRTLKFAFFQNFTKKQKSLNLGQKMPYLSIFDQKYRI